MKKLRTSTVISVIICLALGIALICHPVKAAIAFYLAIGGGLVILGAIYCISYLAHKNKEDKRPLDIVIGVPTLLLGLSVMIFYGVAVNVIQYVMGILIIIHGLSNLSQAFQVKKLGYGKWGTVFLLGIITILLGVILLCGPFAEVISINFLAGIFLIFDAFSDLYVFIKVATSEEGKAAAAAEKAERKALKETDVVNEEQKSQDTNGNTGDDKEKPKDDGKWHW